MSSDSGLHPVSGEILGSLRAAKPRRPVDAVDAEFETFPTAPAATPRPSSAPDHSGLAILSRAEPDPASNRAGPAFWGVGLLIVAAAFWFSGGHAMFRFDQPLAVFEEAPAFDVLDLQTRVERINGRTVLLVDGAVQNIGMQPAKAPGVVLNVESEAGKTVRYALGLGGQVLEPGDTAAFSSRLDAPDEGVKRVFMTFPED